jgi:exosortase H (IPTLxxWG-CTERM-specific)
VPVNPRQKRFLLRFFGLLVLFYVIVTPKPVDEAVVQPFTRGIAVVSTAVLNALGQEVTRTGTLINNRAFAVDIKNGCNGLEALVFLCAAIFAFDAPFRNRLVGVAIGAVIVEILNLMRVVTLFLIGRYRPELFELFHLAVWQAVIFGAAVFTFISWTARQRTHAAAQ